MPAHVPAASKTECVIDPAALAKIFGDDNAACIGILNKFVDQTQKKITGTAKLKLYKGSCTCVGRKSKYSLYNEDLASFTTGDLYSHKDAGGFINLYGLQVGIESKMHNF